MAKNSPTIIQKDFYRESGQWLSPLGVLKKCINPNLHYLYLLRKCQQSSKRSIRGLFWRLLLRRYQIRYGFQIYPETQIGEGFYLGHWGAVVINPEAKIGANCNIAQGVTIAQANRGKNKGAPTIGDEVWIGPNAVVVGHIKIGNDVLIAPNAYVSTDVPSHSIALGNPAQIIPKENATLDYINHKIEPLKR